MKRVIRNLAWRLRSGSRQETKRKARGHQPLGPPPGPPPQRPQPDWARSGTQPKGHVGSPPRPNRRAVATKPDRAFEAHYIHNEHKSPQEWMAGRITEHFHVVTGEPAFDVTAAYRPLNEQVRLIEAMRKLQSQQAIGSPFWNFIDEQLEKEEARLSTILPDEPKNESLFERVTKVVNKDLSGELQKQEAEIERLRIQLEKERERQERTWKTVSSIGRRGQRRYYKIPPPGPPNPMITSPTLPSLPRLRKKSKNQYAGTTDDLDMSIPLGLTFRERQALKRLEEHTKKLREAGGGH